MIKHKILQLAFTSIGLLLGSSAFAQTTINAASNSASIGNYKFDYTIGEMAVISTDRTSTLIVTQGYLQPITNAPGTQQQGGGLSDWASQVKVYPNPTDNILYFDLNETAITNYQTQIIDAAGKLITTTAYTSAIGFNQLKFDLSTIASGTYFLIVSKPNDEKVSFKIQKTSK
jgi:hypothetical protein